MFLMLTLSQWTYGGQVKPSERQGAKVFSIYCTLCHGNYGLGEGPMPFSLKNYPNTNLMDARFGKDPKTLREIIIYGGYKKGLGDLMPPWGDELTFSNVQSVIMFMSLLHSNNEKALDLLDDVRKTTPVVAKKSIGRVLYKGRCSICHGAEGEGNGRMASRISPRPFNLTKSRLSKNNLKKIIMGGGASVGRSPSMPPWGDELSPSEINSIILHLMSLR